MYELAYADWACSAGLHITMTIPTVIINSEKLKTSARGDNATSSPKALVETWNRIGARILHRVLLIIKVKIKASNRFVTLTSQVCGFSKGISCQLLTLSAS